MPRPPAFVKAARLGRRRAPWLKLLASAKAARNFQSRSPLLIKKAAQQSRSGFRILRFNSSAVFQHESTGRTQKQSRFFNKKAAIRTRLLHCTRATKPQRLSKNTALFLSTFQHGLSTQNNREVTANKAALLTKKPPSVPPSVAKAARRCQSRSPLPKPLSVAKAALHCHKAARVKAARLLKPLAIVKAARHC